MIYLRRPVLSVALAGLLMSGFPAVAAEVSAKAVMETYTEIAHAAFSDSLATAKTLQGRVEALVDGPSEETMQAAREAWLAARVPYGQTEVYRFGNANVDDWEGKVNAWPLDEGLIDYVADSYEHEDGNEFAAENIIAGDEGINAELLQSSHEKGGSEANVATGYHAIEFLLWGQDLNKNPADTGSRTYTDFVRGEGCTNGNCDRRAKYLTEVTGLLVKDLQEMVADWEGGKDNYRKEFMALDENEALRRMLFGMGSLSLGELAGERINVALLAHSQEDEHSCFSDNTHVDIAENARGIQNTFNGTYTKVDGSKVEGPGLADLVAVKDEALSKKLIEQLNDSQQKAAMLVDAAEQGEHFDQQIVSGNETGNARVKAVIDALRTQTGSIEAVSGVLGIENLSPESSDSFGS
ncbi:MAG: imelysin family protein [Thiolinea sp.]